MDTHYRVCWKFRTAKHHVVRDYHAPDLKTLMAMIKRSEGVDPDSVQELVIHQINSDGSVTEMVSACDPKVEMDRLLDKAGESNNTEKIVTTNLERIKDAIIAGRNGTNTSSKPRIRLLAKPAPPVDPHKVYSANGLYHATVATKFK